MLIIVPSEWIHTCYLCHNIHLVQQNQRRAKCDLLKRIPATSEPTAYIGKPTIGRPLHFQVDICLYRLRLLSLLSTPFFQHITYSRIPKLPFISTYRLQLQTASTTGWHSFILVSILCWLPPSPNTIHTFPSHGLGTLEAFWRGIEITPFLNDAQLTVFRFTALESPRNMDMMPTAIHIILWPL